MNSTTKNQTFLVINTPQLWRDAAETDAQLAGRDTMVTDQGVSLNALTAYRFTRSIDTRKQVPLSLAGDGCGQLFALMKLDHPMDKTVDKAALMLYPLNALRGENAGVSPFTDAVSMAVSETDFYIIYENKLTVLARSNLQIRRETVLKPGSGGTLRIALRESFLLYMLDTVSKQVFRLDWDWQPGQESLLPLKTATGEDVVLDAPKDIAGDGAGFFYILEADLKAVLKFDADGVLLAEIPIPHTFQENTFISLGVCGCTNGNRMHLGFIGNDPMTAQEVFGILQLKETPIYKESGTFVSVFLDSTVKECQWHRLELAADIPENTMVKLSYYASQSAVPLGSPEPFGQPIVNAADALLLNAKGRYLRIKLELSGDTTGESSPLLRRLKVHFPRRSYLRYLPAAYQEDKESRVFLEKFLALFETILTGTETKILRSARYFDAAGTPAEFIPWLSSWLAIAYDQNWPLEKKRSLLKAAPKLYKMRGTRRLLQQLIQLYIDIDPIIVERFQLRCETDPQLQQTWDRLFGTGSYTFCVLLPPQAAHPSHNTAAKPLPLTTAQTQTLQRIIATEKPAHTCGGLQVLQPWLYLDMHTYLGINTYLTRPEWVIDSASVIGRDTLLTDKDDSAQVERNSRIGNQFKVT